MKQYFLGILAIVMALGLSSFSLPKHKGKTTDYWFYVTVSRPAGASLTFINTQVSYYGNSVPGDCYGTGHYCAVKFQANQVIDNGPTDVTLDGTQTASDDVEML